jgi:glycosyltransferase involved in cell wall biosynthesis
LGKDKINLALFWSKYSSTVTSVNDLVLGLDKERYKIIFIYMTCYGIERNLIEEAGYEVFYLSNIEFIQAFRFSILFRLVKVLKENNIDILHCHRHKASFYGAIAGILAKTPVVLSHVHGLSRTKNLGRRIFNFILFKRFNKIIGCAKSVRDDVLKNNPSVSREKVIALENSVDYEHFTNVSISKEEAKKMLGVSPDVFVFGTVGRLAPTKGLSYLIEAFQEVKERKPSAHLVLLGDGQCRVELEEQVSNTLCSDSIHFLGHRNNIEQLLKGMDVFVLSSIAEGMPLVILEAMAAGIPCIATRVGGIEEIINSDEVGTLIPSKDSEALAKAMINMGEASKEELEQYTKKASDRIRKFYSHDIVRKKLEITYEKEMNLYFKGNRFQKSSKHT